MKLPIKNRTSIPLTLFIEPYCDQYEIPPEGEAIVILDDGKLDALIFHPDNWVSLWNEGEHQAVVEIVSKEQNAVFDALDFAQGWLHQYGQQGQAAAKDLRDAIQREENSASYLQAHFAAYRAFREGFKTKSSEAEPANPSLPEWQGNETLAGAYSAGGVGAYFNYRTRFEPTLVELGKAPFDTDIARDTFKDADAAIG